MFNSTRELRVEYYLEACLQKEWRNVFIILKSRFEYRSYYDLVCFQGKEKDDEDFLPRR